MRKPFALSAAVCLLFSVVAPLAAQSNQQLLQGMQLRLVLLNGLSTSVAREGDPFLAVLAEPVYLGGQLLLPAGARVHGQVGNIIRPKRFAMFRGQAAMNLYFHSIELDGRMIPAKMSLLALFDERDQQPNRKRRDLDIEEGILVESKPDIRGDVTRVALATAGGTGVGAIFSKVVRGMTIGLIGGTAYIMVKKGREVELPAQTGMLVRLDETITLPNTIARNAPYTSGDR